MQRTGRKKEWSVVVFAIALLLLFPPILSIYDKSDFVFGMPVSYLAFFAIWAVVIALTAFGARPSKPDGEGAKPSPETLGLDQERDGQGSDGQSGGEDA